MTHQTQTTWQKDLHFITSLDDKEIHFDATALAGDYNQGVSPKKMILSGLAGCTGMDVAALLEKRYKIDFSDLSIDVSGELTPKHPKYYHKIHVTYQIKVAPEHQSKVREAVDLSREKFCGVQAMLEQASDITHEINFI